MQLVGKIMWIEARCWLTEAMPDGRGLAESCSLSSYGRGPVVNRWQNHHYAAFAKQNQTTDPP